MKRPLFLFGGKRLFLGLILFSACQTENVSKKNPAVEVRPLTNSEAKIVSHSNDFAFKIFSRISQAEGDQNVFISPLSISSALTMAYNGANTTTKEAFEKTLDFGLLSQAEINQSYQSLSKLLTGIDPKVEFTSANSMWYNRTIRLQAPFVTNNTTYFDATVQGLNFGDPQAKSTINGWVKEKTKGKIEDIVDEVTNDHLLFLVNAIYFKGIWTYPFDKEKTTDGTFRRKGGAPVTVPFMALTKAKFRYFQDTNQQLIELPYGNRQFSMLLLLPKESHTIESLLTQLNTQSLNGWLNEADSVALDLYLPKFSFAYKKTLNETLSQMGLEEAFGNKADFSRMVEGAEKGAIAIDKVRHKAFVEVNEEGTEAAAATSVGVVLTSMPPSIRLDRPFIFLIREKATNTILFAGKLMNPKP